MKKKYWIKAVSDAVILLCSLILCFAAYLNPWVSLWSAVILAAAVLCAALAIVDLICQRKQIKKEGKEEMKKHGTGVREIDRLILLDEQDKPVKSWDMAGRVSMVIGREGGEEEIDVDLEDCAFSSFIDFQHAVLNFCLDQWYVEDLGSQDGVRVRKAEDGECYKVMGRPCRIQAGDVLYIANPRLINVLHKDTVYLKDGEIDQICLCRELVEIHRVFGVKGKHRTDIVIAGDVLEEMLKEEIVGFQAVPVSVKEGTPWQKNM